MNAHTEDALIKGKGYIFVYYVNRQQLFPYGDVPVDDSKVMTTAWFNPYTSASEADIIPNFNDLRGYMYDRKLIPALKSLKIKQGLIEITIKKHD